MLPDFRGRSEFFDHWLVSYRFEDPTVILLTYRANPFISIQVRSNQTILFLTLARRLLFPSRNQAI
jgi:hypothetical protein